MAMTNLLKGGPDDVAWSLTRKGVAVAKRDTGTSMERIQTCGEEHPVSVDSLRTRYLTAEYELYVLQNPGIGQNLKHDNFL